MWSHTKKRQIEDIGLYCQKYNGMFERFDSYGIKPDKELQWINIKKRRTFKHTLPYLGNFLDDERYMHNHVRCEYMRVAHSE